MVQLVIVLKVRPVNRELVESVEHTFHVEIASPWIRPIPFENEHSMVHSGALEWAHSIHERGRGIMIWRRTEDDIPLPRDVVNFWRPELGI